MNERLSPTPSERAVPLDTRVWWIAPIAAALGTAALAEIRIGEDSLQVDEAIQVAVARSSLGTIWATARDDDMTHLTTHLVWKPWLELAGQSEETVRYPSLIFAALAAALTVLVGRELAGWLAGAVAGAVFATSSFVLHAAITADGKALVLFLVLLSTYALLRATTGDHTAWWVLYALAAVGTVTVDLASSTVIAAHLAYIGLRRPASWTRATIALFVVAVAVAAFLALTSRGGSWALDWLADPTPRSIGDALWDLFGRNPFAVVAVAGGSIALAAGWTGAERAPTAALLWVWLVGPLAATLVTSLWRPAFDPGYLIASTASAALLAGVAVGALARTRVAPGAIAVAVVALAAGSVISVAHYVDDRPAADWRGASLYVVGVRKPSDEIIVAPSSHTAAFAYYAGDVEVAPEPRSGTVWVVASGSDADRQLLEGRAAVGAPAYALLEERSFGGALMVQHWIRP